METDYGFYVLIRGGYRLDFATNGAVRVYSQEHEAVATINLTCYEAAIIHPNCRAHLSNDVVEISSDQRHGKLCPRGVIFTGRNPETICFVVDEGGCRSTTEKFHPLARVDFSSHVLYKNLKVDPQNHKRFVTNAATSFKHTTRGENELWTIAGYSICRRSTGELTISKFPSKLFLCIAGDGQIKLKMGKFKVSTSYTFVNITKWRVTEEEEQLEASLRIRDDKLVARYGKQEGGLDRRDVLFLK